MSWKRRASTAQGTRIKPEPWEGISYIECAHACSSPPITAPSPGPNPPRRHMLSLFFFFWPILFFFGAPAFATVRHIHDVSMSWPR
jgi:hypothetical protein